MRPYVSLEYLRTHFRVTDPEVQMEYEMSHHCEGSVTGYGLPVTGKETR